MELQRDELSSLLVTDVEARLLKACKTIRALPDRDRRFQTLHNLWPEILQDAADAYGYQDAIMPRFRPTPADVSDCLVALAWARVLEKREFRLIWWRSFGMSFRQIGMRLGRTGEAVRLWYKDAMLKAWYEACRQKSIA